MEEDHLIKAHASKEKIKVILHQIQSNDTWKLNCDQTITTWIERTMIEPCKLKQVTEQIFDGCSQGTDDGAIVLIV